MNILIVFLLLLGIAGAIGGIYFLPKISKTKIIAVSLLVVVTFSALFFYEIYEAAQTLPPNTHIINKYEMDTELIVGETPTIYKLYFNGKVTPLFSNDNICCVSKFSLSPNGKKVVFHEMAGPKESFKEYLTVMDIAGSNKKRLFDLSANKQVHGINTIAWSPSNNDEIAFLSDYNYDKESYSLYLFNAKTKILQAITKDSVSALGVSSFSWSPDGTKIAFISLNNELMIIDKYGSNLHQIVSDANVPAWSPNGKLIAYREGKNYVKKFSNGNAEYNQKGNNRYYIFNLQTGEKKEIFNNKQLENISLDVFVQPVWSPDSKYVLLYKTYDLSFKTDFYIIDVNSGKIVQHFKTKIKPVSVYWRSAS